RRVRHRPRVVFRRLLRGILLRKALKKCGLLDFWRDSSNTDDFLCQSLHDRSRQANHKVFQWISPGAVNSIEERLGYKERPNEKLIANRIRLYASTVSSSTE